MDIRSRSFLFWDALRFCIFASLFCFIAVEDAYAGRIEAGTFIAHNTNTNPNPVTVSFSEPFDTVPIVVALIGLDEADPAKIRITNVTTTGFDELVIEPDGVDGVHTTELIHYVAVEPGRHVLPGGDVIEAGFANVSAVQHGIGVAGAEGYQTIFYSAPLPGNPVVLAHLQSANSETANVATTPSAPFITATIRDANGSSFRVALERSESPTGPIPSTESVGWIAFPTPSSGVLFDVDDNAITWSSVNTARNIRGFQDGCFINGFGQSSTNAIVVAKKSSHRGGDGGWIRRCSLSSSTIGLTVDEDTAFDVDRNHILEKAAIIAFSQPFHANVTASLITSKERVSTTGVFGDLNVPGAIVEYSISVINEGSSVPDPNTVEVIDNLPLELAFVVSDFGGVGSGPIQFIDGSPSSDLTCVFVALADPTDCYGFSTDGSNFSYVPTDSGDGTDPAVRHIRVTPTGVMAANSGNGDPNFKLRLRVRIR